jgi:hypothetical protein
MKFVLVPEIRGRWTWELRSLDGRATATSAMSFGSQQAALASIQAFVEGIKRVPIDVAALADRPH